MSDLRGVERTWGQILVSVLAPGQGTPRANELTHASLHLAKNSFPGVATGPSAADIHVLVPASKAEGGASWLRSGRWS